MKQYAMFHMLSRDRIPRPGTFSPSCIITWMHLVTDEEVLRSYIRNTDKMTKIGQSLAFLKQGLRPYKLGELLTF